MPTITATKLDSLETELNELRKLEHNNAIPVDAVVSTAEELASIALAHGSSTQDQYAIEAAELLLELGEIRRMREATPELHLLLARGLWAASLQAMARGDARLIDRFLAELERAISAHEASIAEYPVPERARPGGNE